MFDLRQLALVTTLTCASALAFAFDGSPNFGDQSENINGNRVIFINQNLPYVSGRAYPTIDYENPSTTFTSGFISNTMYLIPVLPRQKIDITGFTLRTGSTGSTTTVYGGLFDMQTSGNATYLPGNRVATFSPTLISGGSAYFTVPISTGSYTLDPKQPLYYGIFFDSVGNVPSMWGYSPATCVQKIGEIIGASTTSPFPGPLATGGCGFTASGASSTLGVSASIPSNTLGIGSGTTGAPQLKFIVR